MGAYTTRNAPAPRNGDEIVAVPIAGPTLRTILPFNCRITRERRLRYAGCHSIMNISQVSESRHATTASIMQTALRGRGEVVDLGRLWRLQRRPGPGRKSWSWRAHRRSLDGSGPGWWLIGPIATSTKCPLASLQSIERSEAAGSCRRACRRAIVSKRACCRATSPSRCTSPAARAGGRRPCAA